MVGPQQLTGNPAIGNGLFCCECIDCSFLDLLLLAAIKTITATIIVPQIAALAAIVILSIFDVCDETVLTSRHCEYGTVSGDTFNSSNDITQTTIHSCDGTFFILNSRSLASSGGPCLNVLSPNKRYTTRKPRIFAVSESHCMMTELSCRKAFLT